MELCEAGWSVGKLTCQTQGAICLSRNLDLWICLQTRHSRILSKVSSVGKLVVNCRLFSWVHCNKIYLLWTYEQRIFTFDNRPRTRHYTSSCSWGSASSLCMFLARPWQTCCTSSMRSQSYRCMILRVRISLVKHYTKRQYRFAFVQVFL